MYHILLKQLYLKVKYDDFHLNLKGQMELLLQFKVALVYHQLLESTSLT